MDEFKDEELICKNKDCGETFIHSAGEQQWMQEKWGDDYRKPAICKNCRRKRKEAQAQENQ